VESFLIGMALGLVVSASPGPNTVMCIKLAAGGVRGAVPVITSAALTDAAYSLLAASGLMLANQANPTVMAYGAPLVFFGAAALALPSFPATKRVATLVPILNPATAAMWLGLSSFPRASSASATDVLIRPLPVAMGTALWFTALAAASAGAQLRIGPANTSRLHKWLAAVLVGLGLLSLLRLL
jgi:threonine/homoserine/homoserine lactone efflux protein